MNSTDDKRARPAKAVDPLQAWGLGIVGAILGAVAGWFIFGWLLGQGFYMLALPGALVGLGFGYLSRSPMIAGGIFCAILALPLTVACEWSHRPFSTDESLGYFLSNFHKMDSVVTYIMLAFGVLCAFWFGRGR